MEEWALDHDRCIGVSLQDDSDALRLPPHQRPGLVRLGVLAFGEIPGGVLIESIHDFGDVLSRVVICRLLLKLDRDVFLPARELSAHKQSRTPQRVSQAKVKEWEEEAGQDAVEDADADFREVVNRAIVDEIEHRGIDFAICLGTGRLRDADLARDQDSRLQSQGWSDSAILDYLRLYGYANPIGKVGSWSPEHLKSLRSGS